MSIKKNLFYNLFLNVTNLLFPIVTVPYISRVLGVENVGLINFAISYVGYFVLFAALGVSYYGIREIAKYKDDQEKCCKIFSGIFKINIFSTIIVTLFYFASILLIPELKKDCLIFILAGVNLYLVPLSIDWYYQGLENFKVIAFRSLIIKSISFICLFIFVRERGDVIPYILLSVFSTVGAYFWNVFYAKKKGLKITWKNVPVRPHIKPMFIFFASNVAGSFFVTLDTLMLGFLSSYEEVGFFTSPNKILMVIITTFAAISIVLLPRISYYKEQNDDEKNKILLQKAFDITSLLIIPCTVGLCLIAPRFVPLFFGNEFLGSIIPMQILSFKIIVVMLNYFFAINILTALGYEKKYLIALISAAVLSFILNLIYIPKYGAIGAAATSVVAEGFELILNIYFVYKFTTIKVKWREMGNSFIFTLPIVGLFLLFNKFIGEDLLFLFIFGITAISLYFSLQIFINRNSLLIQLIHSVIDKIKKS